MEVGMYVCTYNPKHRGKRGHALHNVSDLSVAPVLNREEEGGHEIK